MPFQPDIVVTGPDGVALVVEAKPELPDLANSEQQLKRYMSGMQCPTGVVVTPERIWLYRDRYTTRSPASIQRVAEFDTKGIWRQPPPTDPLMFEAFVQQWLEQLVDYPSQDLPPNIKDALDEFVIPALANGDVRAAHPRYQ